MNDLIINERKGDKILWTYDGLDGTTDIVDEDYVCNTELVNCDNIRLTRSCQIWIEEQLAAAVLVAAESERIWDAWEQWEEETGDLLVVIPSIDHTPDEIAFETPGVEFRLVALHEGWGQGSTFVSAPVENPTWGDVMRQFEVAVQMTGDTHHNFMEGLILLPESKYHKLPPVCEMHPEDTIYLQFCTGS